MGWRLLLGSCDWREVWSARSHPERVDPPIRLHPGHVLHVMDFAIRLPLTVSLPPSARTDSISPVDSESLTDGELLRRIAARDHAAFEELHGRYRRAVFGLALRRLGDRGRAEDATQEVFTAVWRSARSYDAQRGSGSAWLFTVARNGIINTLRRRPELVAEAPDLPDSEASPPEQTEAAWVSWRVHRALEELPGQERPLIELAYWSGLSQSEIAEFLQVPLGTVKTRTRSALARLADALEGELR
jgi:RNA polymerase sigma-70 factor, ECF subfamily